MKKIGFIGLLITAALLLVFAFPAAASGPKAPAGLVAPVAAVPVVAAMPEKHPHIDEALESMRAAKSIWRRLSMTSMGTA